MSIFVRLILIESSLLLIEIRQELLTLREHLSSPGFFLWGSVLPILLFVVVVLLCVFTFWVPCRDVLYDFPIKWCLVRLYLQLFVGVFLLPCSGVQHILCCAFAFALYVFVFSTLCCQFLWIVHLWLTLRYLLTFIAH